MVRTFFSSRRRPPNRSPQPRHPWALKHLSRVQRQLSVSRSKKASQGFAMFVILLLMLTVLTTTVSLNTRTTAGMFISSWQGKLRLARDAAENGLVISASELNKPSNRMLLGSVPLDKWRTNDYNVYTDWNNVTVRAGQVIYPSPCRFLPNWDVYQITQEALNMSSINPPVRTVYDSDNGQYYRVLGIKLTKADRSAVSRSTETAAQNAVSYLTITVEGIYSLGTAPTTANPNPTNSVHYTVQQEYQLVPRCCRQIAYPVDTGSTANACAAVNLYGAYKPEWIARSTSQAGLFKTNQ